MSVKFGLEETRRKLSQLQYPVHKDDLMKSLQNGLDVRLFEHLPNTSFASPDEVLAALQVRTLAGKRIRDEVRALVPLLRREALKGEQLGELTPEVLQALDKAGVFKIALPVELGGSALGARDTVEVITEIARGDGAPAWIAVVSTVIRNALGFPQQTFDEIFSLVDTWVGPLMFGANVFFTTGGSARKVDGGWMVSGTWHFGSGCKHAAWGAVGVDCVDEQGRTHLGMALLPRDQFTILDDWHVMGVKGTSSNSVTVDGEVFVPDHRMIDTADVLAMQKGMRSRYDGIAFRGGPLSLKLMASLYFAALALGMARGTLECFIEQARVRKPFSMPYPTVGNMPSTQVTAGKASAMINAVAALIHQRADEVDLRAVRDEDVTPLEEPEISMDMVYAIQLCANAIDMLQIALGSSTVSLKNPIQRFARDVRVLMTHGSLRLDPTAEIYGRQLFGLEPFPMFADSARAHS